MLNLNCVRIIIACVRPSYLYILHIFFTYFKLLLKVHVQLYYRKIFSSDLNNFQFFASATFWYAPSFVFRTTSICRKYLISQRFISPILLLMLLHKLESSLKCKRKTNYFVLPFMMKIIDVLYFAVQWKPLKEING